MDKIDQLYNLLKATFFLLDDGDRHLFDQYNLSPPRFYAMVHINEEPGISSSGLSQRLLCDKSNVTRIVRGLEKQGLIERKAHETDGRTLRLYLTPQGQETCNRIQIAHKQYNKTRLNNITSTAQNNLLDKLTQLNDALQAELATNEVHNDA